MTPISESYGIIPLTGLNGRYVAKVDWDDWLWLLEYGWNVSSNKMYAQTVCPMPQPGMLRPRTDGRYTYNMHRMILGLHKGDPRQVDHINHDTLDNRRANLRICTNGQNGIHRRPKVGPSGYQGVTWHKQRRKWQASINIDGKTVYLGGFDDPKLAHEAWKAKAIEVHPEFRIIL